MKPTPQHWAEIRRDVSECGFTVKLDYIDGDPAGKLNGIRFMDCRELMDRALTIQIFSRDTVTIGWGFENVDHVTLTKEDGRLFLEWLKEEDDTPLVEELWNMLPEAMEAEDRTRAGATNMGKATLVEYLVYHHADIFGKYGSIDQHAGELPPGEDFYLELLNLVKNPERDERDQARLIQSLEETAAGLYLAVNNNLRIGTTALKWQAFGLAMAAEQIRDSAQVVRGRMFTKPPETPARTPTELSAAAIYAQLRTTEPENPAPPEGFTLPRVMPDVHLPIRPGELVVILWGHMRPAEIGQVLSVTDVDGEPVRVEVRFSDGKTVDYPIEGVRRTAQ